MPLVDQELQEFEELLEYMEQAELGLMMETPTQAKARTGEEAMRTHYRNTNWTVYPQQKSLTGPGPDAIIWKRDTTKPGAPLEVRIVDNKSGNQRVVVCPTGLSRRSLWGSLKGVVEFLSTKPDPKTPPDPKDPRNDKDVIEVCKLLNKTRFAAVKGEKLPPGVTLWVTNACGNAESVHLALFPTEAGRSKPKAYLDDIRKATKGSCPPST
jgi:hypothetical protein